MKKQQLLFLVAALALSGCVLNRPYMLTDTTSEGTNGVVSTSRKLVKTTTLALWPGTTAVGKQSSTLTDKSMRTGASDISGETSASTNDVQMLGHIRAIMGR